MSSIRPRKLLPKDYIMTAEGLYFAVVLHADSRRPAHCSLRYGLSRDGTPEKLDTGRAFEFLSETHPHYIAYSEILDADTIMVPGDSIAAVYRPREALAGIERSCGNDKLKQTAAAAIDMFTRNGIRREAIGITGSLMLDFHHATSDIDIVFYDANAFRLGRDLIRNFMGRNGITPLDEASWVDAHKRRGCALDFDSYKEHELRKYNKFVLDGTRIDLSYVPPESNSTYRPPVKKIGHCTTRGKVMDDTEIFSYPARYTIDNKETGQILCYTATYTGQAFAGEYIEASGMLERDAEGRQYLVIGTSREAPGEYIRVIGL